MLFAKACIKLLDNVHLINRSVFKPLIELNKVAQAKSISASNISISVKFSSSKRAIFLRTESSWNVVVVTLVRLSFFKDLKDNEDDNKRLKTKLDKVGPTFKNEGYPKFKQNSLF